VFGNLSPVGLQVTGINTNVLNCAHIEFIEKNTKILEVLDSPGFDPKIVAGMFIVIIEKREILDNFC